MIDHHRSSDDTFGCRRAEQEARAQREAEEEERLRLQAEEDAELERQQTQEEALRRERAEEAEQAWLRHEEEQRAAAATAAAASLAGMSPLCCIWLLLIPVPHMTRAIHEAELNCCCLSMVGCPVQVIPSNKVETAKVSPRDQREIFVTAAAVWPA